MKVPLIIYDPHATERGKRIKSFVTLLDIAPTILKTMRWKELAHFQGGNLLQLREDKEFSIFEEAYKPEDAQNRFALLQIPWHLISVPEERKYELFDLREDPGERKNVFSKGSLPQEVMKLKQRLDSFSSKVLEGKGRIKIDKKAEEMLRSLCYIK